MSRRSSRRSSDASYDDEDDGDQDDEPDEEYLAALSEIAALTNELKEKSKVVDEITVEHALMVQERDSAVSAREQVTSERDQLQLERDRLAAEVAQLTAEVAPWRIELARRDQETRDLDNVLARGCLKKAELDAARPENRGLRIKDLIEFHARIRNDMDAYTAAHAEYSDGKSVLHVSKQDPCPFHDDHRGCPAIPINQVPPGAVQPLRGNVRLVVDRYVKHETRNAGASYSSLVNNGKPLRATTFVVHTWEEDFGQFVDTLSSALGEREVAFMCSFCLDCNAAGGELTQVRDPSLSPWAAALKASRQVLVAMDSALVLPSRLWCVYEVFMAMEQHVPVMVWPHRAVDLKQLSSSLAIFDVRAASATAEYEMLELQDVLGSYGIDYVNIQLRDFLRVRIRAFQLGCTGLAAERKGCSEAAILAGSERPLNLGRLRTMVADRVSEADRARDLVIENRLRTGVQFAEVSGALFEHDPLVCRIADPLLGRDVFLVNGVCLFKCVGRINVGSGVWSIAFSLKRGETLSFDADVALLLNGAEARRVRLEKALPKSFGWTLLEVGQVTGNDEQVEVAMLSMDGPSPQPKVGLFVDRVVAVREPF